MSAFSRRAYKAVCESFRQRGLYNMNWSVDFELAAMNAIDEEFGDDEVYRLSGCLRHYTLKVHEAVERYGLVPLFQQHQVHLRRFLRRLSALPRLESAQIEVGWREMCLDLQQRNDAAYTAIRRLRDYVEDQWLGRVGPARLSVHGRYSATTNPVETHHGVFLNKLTKLPIVLEWDVIGKLSHRFRGCLQAIPMALPVGVHKRGLSVRCPDGL